MKRLSTDQIRQTFLEFFKARAHEEAASSSLVPANDPTLLFTNAGMNQFKDVFTGKETRPYQRATTSQKCVRAGGKHNDLENVGYTQRHHTFFEMLGNFSFGDYFKKDAISFAWTFVTEVLELPIERLAVTVFRGEDEVPADDEAAQLWLDIGVPKNQIFRLGKSENYWQMGDTGPQGPCSEIHYCLMSDPASALEERRVQDSDGWMEIWNLVFMQFVRETADGPLLPLPKPSVDTGAGLERLAMVLQGAESTYDTDGFTGLITKIGERVGKSYGGFCGGEESVSMRVIADHARSTAFLIADGVQPDNVGRGYVLRRIMRRAIRHGDRLGFKDLFFYRACLDVVDAMKASYPELERAASLIEKVARHEETSFRNTLDRGLRLLEEELASCKDEALAPEFVAKLYDTYGFPIDLTRVIAEEHKHTVDEDAAHEAVKISQGKSGGEGGVAAGVKAIDKLWFDIRDRVGKTTFTGYESGEGAGKIAAIVKDDAEVQSAGPGDSVLVLLDSTPFYGESGGQVGDRGTLSFEGGTLEVSDTQKPLPELHSHVAKVTEGTLTVGAKVHAQVDMSARGATQKNHSATHLLHLALKEVLGDHVQQKGSLVSPERLRFDFSHFESLKPDEVQAVEARVNEMVQNNAATDSRVGSIEDAKAEGAMMLFGEKYGDEVRMVRIDDSFELCGGTHVARAGDIGLFKLVSDGAVAAGVRRVEAVTGMGALSWVQSQEKLLREAAGTLKAGPEQVPERINKLLKKNKELERDLEKARTQAAMGTGPSTDQVEEIAGMKVLFKKADGTPKKALRPLADQLRDKLQSGVVVLTAVDGDRVALLVAATKDLAKKVHAGNTVKAACTAMGGSGGGRPDFAQGGGPADQVEAGLAAARAALAG